MVNLIFYDEDGHKVAVRITSEEKYFDVRNTAENVKNFMAARGGDAKAKMKLAQFNYNDQLPDGVLKGCHTAASTFAHDIDCRSKEECEEIAQRMISMKAELGLLELSVSANWGLHAVCTRKAGKTILENQVNISLLTKTEMDTNAHDQQRIMFTGPADPKTLLYLDDKLFDEPMSVEKGQLEYDELKERESKGEEVLPPGAKKSNKHYRPWEDAGITTWKTTEASIEEKLDMSEASADVQPIVFNTPVVDIINTMYPQGAPKGRRHPTALRLANDLIILLDGDQTLVKKTLLSLPWVQTMVKERTEKELDDIIDSARKLQKKRESENFYAPKPSREMQKAVKLTTGRKYDVLLHEERAKVMGSELASQDDIQQTIIRIGDELGKLKRYYPLMKHLFFRIDSKHYPAVFFVGGAFAMTLMTRCWYQFWPKPGKQNRLNSLVLLIGRMGSMKSMAVDLYTIMMEPVKRADAAQVKSLNDWNREKEQNNGGSKNKSQRPAGIYRALPPETSTAALREAESNAHEEIDGNDWYYHVSIFDSELQNTLSQMKKGYMDAMLTYWLKSYHSELHGAYLKTSSAPVGETPVHFNAVYTGTIDAMNKLNTESNNVNGLMSRFTAIPNADSNFEMLVVHDYDADALQRDQDLKEWAERLDATKGEIPCKLISNFLKDWTERRMKDAKENDDLAQEDLVKRPCWHAINFALPYIVTRHWDKMVQDKDGRWKCGPNFKVDKTDVRLAILIANAQLAFQEYWCKSILEKHYDDEIVNQISNIQRQPKTQLAFRRLPNIFTSEDVKKAYGYCTIGSVCSRLKRLQDDGLAQKIRSGEDKGKYRKLA